jgi:hypothetical protein
MPDEPAAKDSHGYKPPALVWLGRLEELTAASPLGPNADSELFSEDVSPSDRTLKERFGPVDTADVLAGVVDLRIERWRYRGDGATHIGPMAQDFAAAFGVGDDDRVIHNLDASGVALAAVQALAAEVSELRAQLKRLS